MPPELKKDAMLGCLGFVLAAAIFTTFIAVAALYLLPL